MRLKNKETPFYSTLVNFVGSQSIFIINLLTGILVARALGPENKGVYVASVLVITVYSPIFVFGYNGGVLYNFVTKRLNISSFFYVALTALFVISLFSGLSVMLLAQQGLLGDIILKLDSKTKFYIFTAVVFYILKEFFEVTVRSKNMFLCLNLSTIIMRSFMLMFCAVALYYKSLNVLLVIKAYLFSIICSILYLAYSLKISTKLSLKLKEVNQIFVPWKYGIKYWVSQIVSTSNDKFDQILLSFILPSSSLGIFATAVGVSKLTARIPSSYTQVFFNQIAVKSQVDALTLLEKAHRVTLALSVFMSFFLSACATKIIVLLYGNDYRVSLVVILAYLPGLICQICARLIIKFFSAQGKPLKNAAIYSFGFFCGLPLYFLLVPKLGLTGASICSSVSYFISYLFSIYQLAKNYNVDWKYFYVIKWDDMRHIYNLFCRLINRR